MAMRSSECGLPIQTRHFSQPAKRDTENALRLVLTLATLTDDGDEASSSARYRTQKRGGKGLRDIKTTDRNGKVVGIASVNDEDELLLMTAKGKIQRIKCSEISTIGRNTQGVRIMRLKDDDTLATIVRVPRDELENEEGVVEGSVS